MDDRVYRVTMISEESESTVARLLNMAGLEHSHSKAICRKNGVDLSLTKDQVNKLQDLGFALFRVIAK